MKRLNVKFKFLLICFVIVFCFLTSCRTSRQETQKVDTITEKTKENIVSYKDTIIFSPKAETSLNIPISELVFKQGLNDVSKPKTFTQKNGQATAKVEITPTYIIVTATCDSIAMRAKIKQELLREISATARSDTQNTKKSTGYSFFRVLIASLICFVLGAVVMFILKTLRIL